MKASVYIGDHVASTFHAVHYYRLIGEPTPKAKGMVERVLRDQKEDGSWHLHPPDWDVHASYDALFILRQLGNPKDERAQQAYKKAVQYVLTCRNEDGGFGHYPEWTSDVDAVFFQAGTLAQAGFLEMNPKLKDEEMLGWGHAMIPGREYSCVAETNLSRTILSDNTTKRKRYRTISYNFFVLYRNSYFLTVCNICRAL